MLGLSAVPSSIACLQRGWSCQRLVAFLDCKESTNRLKRTERGKQTGSPWTWGQEDKPRKQWKKAGSMTIVLDGTAQNRRSERLSKVSRENQPRIWRWRTAPLGLTPEARNGRCDTLHALTNISPDETLTSSAYGSRTLERPAAPPSLQCFFPHPGGEHTISWYRSQSI